MGGGEGGRALPLLPKEHSLKRCNDVERLDVAPRRRLSMPPGGRKTTNQNPHRSPPPPWVGTVDTRDRAPQGTEMRPRPCVVRRGTGRAIKHTK